MQIVGAAVVVAARPMQRRQLDDAPAPSATTPHERTYNSDMFAR